MKTHTRALIAASALAYVTGKTVAGVYDHSAKRDLRIAAAFRGYRLRGSDGDRSVEFGGTLPEIHDEGDKTFISFQADGAIVKGYDRGSSSHYEAHVKDGVVQVFDHGENAWFAYDIQDAASAQSYFRDSEAT